MPGDGPVGRGRTAGLRPSRRWPKGFLVRPSAEPEYVRTIDKLNAPPVLSAERTRQDRLPRREGLHGWTESPKRRLLGRPDATGHRKLPHQRDPLLSALPLCARPEQDVGGPDEHGA